MMPTGIPRAARVNEVGEDTTYRAMNGRISVNGIPTVPVQEQLPVVTDGQPADVMAAAVAGETLF